MRARGVVAIRLATGIVMVVVGTGRMRMAIPVVTRGRRGMFDGVQIAHRCERRIDRHAQHQKRQKGGAHESAVMTVG